MIKGIIPVTDTEINNQGAAAGVLREKGSRAQVSTRGPAEFSRPPGRGWRLRPEVRVTHGLQGRRKCRRDTKSQTGKQGEGASLINTCHDVFYLV